VRNVAVAIDKVRIGERTDFDKLSIDFTTDGSVDGKDVMEYVLGVVTQMNQQIQSAFGGPVAEAKPAAKKATKAKKSDLELSEEVVAILEKNGISSKAELEERKEEVADFAGLTSKHLKEIEKYLG
jgi:DNA-directed RNA polymerase subunit alpha